jgi:DNA repair protein RadC
MRSKDSCPVLRGLGDSNVFRLPDGLLEKEHLRVILLDTKNHVLDIVQIYEGSVNSSQVRIGEVFRPAIQRMASAIIVCHNHPSSDCTPSPDDVAVTRAMVQGGKLLDVSVLDRAPCKDVAVVL